MIGQRKYEYSQVILAQLQIKMQQMHGIIVAAD